MVYYNVYLGITDGYHFKIIIILLKINMDIGHYL